MEFFQDSAELTVPDGLAEARALARITHLGIGAHQDDLEFMAFHGIKTCFQSESDWFGGVTCTNGSGSPRSGGYESYTDEEMQAVRRHEQDQAAMVGRYGVMAHLDHPSAVVKDPASSALRDDLVRIFEATRPRVVYTHNPADKHDTHIGVTLNVLRAIRSLPREARPEKVYGCEVWRGLDWLADEEKVVLDVGGHGNLAAALNGIFDSQIAGGKRYDLAVQGRRLANATFYQSHSVDVADEVWFAMDLSPLIEDDELDLAEFVQDRIARFADDVAQRLGRLSGG
ncbi:MAG: PIG-L deacetylase family protein [Verrucomicrobiales bacterium]